MSTVELRHIIIKKLSNIDDVSFLKAIKTIVESKADEKVTNFQIFKRKELKQAESR